MYKLLLKLDISGYKDPKIIEGGESYDNTIYGVLTESDNLDCLKLLKHALDDSSILTSYSSKLIKTRQEENGDYKLYISNRRYNTSREIRVVDTYLSNFKSGEFTEIFSTSSKLMLHEVYKLLDEVDGYTMEEVYLLNKAIKDPSMVNCKKLDKMCTVYKLQSGKLVKVFIKIEKDNTFKTEIVQGSIVIKENDISIVYNSNKDYECIVDCKSIEDAVDFVDDLRAKNLDRVSLIKML